MVSVIIPNYNRSHHLPTCLRSLRRQTYRDFEVVVVDDGSQDGSVKLLEAKFPVVPEIDDSLIGLGKLGHGLQERTGVLSPVIIPVWIVLDYPRHSDEFFFFNRPGMAFSPSHFISKPIDGNPEEPGLKTTGFGISDYFLRHRAEN